MAESHGGKSPYSIQNFLSLAAWDVKKLRLELMKHAKKQPLANNENGVLIVDETGFLKKAPICPGVSGKNKFFRLLLSARPRMGA